jgi:ABC-type multidrug transport system fused ATPase/permease subunit
MNGEDKKSAYVPLMEQDAKKVDPQNSKDDKDKPKASGFKWSIYTRLLRYSRRNCCYLVIANFAMLVTSLAQVAIPWYCGQLLDSINKHDDQLDNLSLQFLILCAVTGVFSFVRGFCYNLVGEKVMKDLRHELFGSIMSKDVEFFDNRKTGELISRLGSDTATI